MSSERVAFKYCGGCDSGFDRVEYFKRIHAAAGNAIEWVTLDDPPFDCVLLICGCQTACPERELHVLPCRIFSIIDDCREPGEIVPALLNEGKQ
jgi:hypothetical protein